MHGFRTSFFLEGDLLLVVVERGTNYDDTLEQFGQAAVLVGQLKEGCI